MRSNFHATVAALAVALAVLAGTVAGLAGSAAGLEQWVAVNLGLAAVGAVAFVAALLLHRAGADGFTEAAGLFAGVLALIAAVDAWNQTRRHPFLPDAAGVTLSIVVPAAVAAVWFGLKHLGARSRG